MAEQRQHRWEMWYPDAGMTGLLFARAQIAATDVVWTHAAPERVSVTVREGNEKIVARGHDLRRTTEKRLPMTRFTLRNGEIARDDRWPGPDDLGAVVILPGGEAAILKSWWHAADESEWRWQVEFYNHV